MPLKGWFGARLHPTLQIWQWNVEKFLQPHTVLPEGTTQSKNQNAHTREQHLAHPLQGGALTQHINPPPSFTISQLISDKDTGFLPPHLLLGLSGSSVIYSSLSGMPWPMWCAGEQWGGSSPRPEAHLWKFPLFGGLLLKQETLIILGSCYLPNKIGQLKKWLFLTYKYKYIYIYFFYKYNFL